MGTMKTSGHGVHFVAFFGGFVFAVLFVVCLVDVTFGRGDDDTFVIASCVGSVGGCGVVGLGGWRGSGGHLKWCLVGWSLVG